MYSLNNFVTAYPHEGKISVYVDYVYIPDTRIVPST